MEKKRPKNLEERIKEINKYKIEIEPILEVLEIADLSFDSTYCKNIHKGAKPKLDKYIISQLLELLRDYKIKEPTLLSLFNNVLYVLKSQFLRVEIFEISGKQFNED